MWYTHLHMHIYLLFQWENLNYTPNMIIHNTNFCYRWMTTLLHHPFNWITLVLHLLIIHRWVFTMIVPWHHLILMHKWRPNTLHPDIHCSWRIHHFKRQSTNGTVSCHVFITYEQWTRTPSLHAFKILPRISYHRLLLHKQWK